LKNDNCVVRNGRNAIKYQDYKNFQNSSNARRALCFPEIKLLFITSDGIRSDEVPTTSKYRRENNQQQDKQMITLFYAHSCRSFQLLHWEWIYSGGVRISSQYLISPQLLTW